MGNTRGHVFWLFGLSGAGKSSLAGKLREAIARQSGREALMLDGDRLRDGLCRGLGFSDEDRTENLRRAAEVARLGLESGLIVIAAFITPRESQRHAVETIVGREACSLVLIDAPLDVCRQRDVKGLYRRAAKGQVEKMTGVTSTFESAGAVALRIDSSRESLDESAAKLIAFAQSRLQA